MGDKTPIEWTDATWNPVTGCSKVSQGCKNCYAERVFPRAYGKERKFTDVQCHPERLDQPIKWKRPRRIFVNSMSDLFHENVPDDFIANVVCIMALAKQHKFQVLTKRPQRMKEFFSDWWNKKSIDLALRLSGADWPTWPLQNVWLGVSVEDQETADERIPLLLQTPAAVRFVSYEPALGPVDLTELKVNRNMPQPVPGKLAVPVDYPISIYPLHGKQFTSLRLEYGCPKLNWIICGGESGPNARPMHPRWARHVRDQCAAAGVPFFFKQWGEWLPLMDADNRGLKYKPDAPFTMIDLTGRLFNSPFTSDPPETIAYGMKRIGKKLAGSLLDGREWKEFPS